MIAEAAGFSRGAFYSNYDSKQALLLEMMSESHEQEIAVWHDLVAHSDNFGKLLAELERRFDSYAEKRENWLLHAELQLEAERDERVGILHRAYSERALENLKAMVLDLLAKGGCAGVDIPIAAAALRAIAHGMMFESSPALCERKPGRAITLFLRALVALSPKQGQTV